MSETEPSRPGAFRPVPRTGVIYVTSEARARGFDPDDPDWCNLGQGQPETGPLDGAPARIESVAIRPEDQDYSPVAGLWELRETVASLYNARYRRGRKSQYTAENVAIGGGGRVSIMRACAAVGPVHMGHFLPDYTAYEELLDVFRRFTPIPILLDPERGYDFSLRELRREILGRGLGALLMSNPCNPTGKLIRDGELESWVALARELDCSMLFDEFYSHYVWKGEGSVSAAAFVEDVDRDPVIVFDGLTKNWRYPGWRVCWTVGPKSVIAAMGSAGSFLDGGPSRPMQRAAIPLLGPEVAQQEAEAIRTTFAAKRRRLVSGLRDLGVRFDLEPEGTFYAWGDVSGLPEGLQTGEGLFRAALEHRVIVVPGAFFDVDPGQRRGGRASRFVSHVRFSFGPPQTTLDAALERLAELVRGRR
ncbi:MAG TPA: pyridoxal phosphate-dependent aminotransferase [Sandaracinaceae bacterium LLY-WYZ-13_1]|nr:pyridoxal phosphate-dependent aminotransferase [Sandaracinaceae bacterium LLY-WYZ-13_1]